MPEVDEDRQMTIVFPDGSEHVFDADRLLTRSVLSHIKSWYGSDDRALGTFWGFQSALGVGDADAATCALWALRRHEGITPNADPRSYAKKIGDPADFAIGKAVIAKNRRADLDPPKWQFQLDEGEPLTLDMDNDVMCSHLRAVRKRYPHCATYAGLYINLLRGDGDAVATGIWIAKLAAGITPNPLPWDMDDFAVGSVSAMHNLPDDDDQFVEPADPTETGKSPRVGTRTSSTTGPSTEIPTTSGGDGPQPSLTTAPE